MPGSRTLLPLVAAALALLPSAGAAAGPAKGKLRDQGVRSISGVVRGPGNAVAPGAVVKLKDLKTLNVRSYIVQADGKYLFQNLPDRVDYEVRADAPPGLASRARTVSLFDSRPRVVINLKLEPAKK